MKDNFPPKKSPSKARARAHCGDGGGADSPHVHKMNMISNDRFKIYSAVYLYLEKDDKILLQQRLNTGYNDGNYGIVSGHLDGNEPASFCLAREAMEEANIILKEEDLKFVHLMHRIAPEREYLDLYFCAEKWMGEIINKEPNKCGDLGWFSFDNLPNNMVSEVTAAIENIKNGVFYSEFGW